MLPANVGSNTRYTKYVEYYQIYTQSFGIKMPFLDCKKNDRKTRMTGQKIFHLFLSFIKFQKERPAGMHCRCVYEYIYVSFSGILFSLLNINIYAICLHIFILNLNGFWKIF